MSSLVLLTSRFPYPPGEEFLKNEVDELSKYFTSIQMIPTNFESSMSVENKKTVPGNVEVYPLSSAANGGMGKVSRIMKLLSDAQSLRWLAEEMPAAAKHGPKAILKLVNWTSIVSEMKQNIVRSRLLDEKSDRVYYSYWLTPSATALAMLKESFPEIKAVSRVHGGDLYLERHQPAYLPYQGKVIGTLSQVYSISENGKEYLTNLYPIAETKVSISRLGTKNEQAFSGKNEKPAALKLISCSYLKPVKRIHLLVEALQNANIPIEWTHIGDGPERGKIEELAGRLPENIKVNFLGNLSNQEVIRNYERNPYDLFINVSESEGIPVTIMEAFSFGIPTAATNVGGTSELVNEENGYLLPKDFKPEQLTRILEQFYQSSLEGQNKKAQAAYATWDQKYNATKNYKTFAEMLKGVLN